MTTILHITLTDGVYTRVYATEWRVIAILNACVILMFQIQYIFVLTRVAQLITVILFFCNMAISIHTLYSYKTCIFVSGDLQSGSHFRGKGGALFRV